MTRFSKLQQDADGKLVETDIREIAQSDLAKCPHFIFMGEHYRPDGSCRCNDPEHLAMHSWGYTWNPDAKRWGEDNEQAEG